jgi:hypothetical protein
MKLLPILATAVIAAAACCNPNQKELTVVPYPNSVDINCGLFNAKGELIGIVNAKSVGENVEGLGFAIPVSNAIKIMTDLIEKGYVSGRVKMGFELFEIQCDPHLIESIRLNRHRYFIVVAMQIAAIAVVTFKLMCSRKTPVNFDLVH